MENLKIQYAQHTPMIDFKEFIEGDFCHGITASCLIEMAKGNIPEKFQKNVTKEESWEYLANFTMEFVGKYLRNWNGATWWWYTEEFFKRLGLPLFRNGKFVYA